MTEERTFENFPKAQGHHLSRLVQKFSKASSIEIVYSKLSSKRSFEILLSEAGYEIAQVEGNP